MRIQLDFDEDGKKFLDELMEFTGKYGKDFWNYAISLVDEKKREAEKGQARREEIEFENLHGGHGRYDRLGEDNN